LPASVTAITGGKIGHIANQVSFENLSNVANVVLSSGQNCINDFEKLGKEAWEKRTQEEINNLEKQVNILASSKKKVFILSVPPVPMATSTKMRKEARRFINSKLSDLCQKTTKTNKEGKVLFVEENEGNFNASTDFTDERHLTPKAIERIIKKLDELLPTSQKLKNAKLQQHPTCKPYKGCYGT